jgi:catechol 2,3-dioxygenase-like lactoylglutathione lyase family enzyme
MTLQNADLITFTATKSPDLAKNFYREVLGLRLAAIEPTALVFDLGHALLRVSIVDDFTPAGYTILGWGVDDISVEIADLEGRGVRFERYDGLSQDERGVCTFPDGTQVAWFKDPDGNILSLTEIV